jgi:hypothetical protein
MSKLIIALHHDDTRILTITKGDIVDIIVEKEKYCPVKIRYNAVKFRAQNIIGLGGTNALMGIDDIMERTHDGYVIETYLPDNTIVESYIEKQQLEGYNNFSENSIHLIRRQDYSSIKVKQDGEVVVITSNQRAQLNDVGYSLQLGKDKDYFNELFGLDSDRRSGVYVVDVAKGLLKTTDDESNMFIVYPNGESIERLSVSFNLDETADSLARKKPNSPRNLPDGEYIEEESKFLVPPKSIIEPMLILIKNDESGIEFLSEKQLEYFFRVREVDTSAINEKDQIRLGTEKVTLHTSLKQIEERKCKSLIDDLIKIPQNVSAAIQTV